MIRISCSVKLHAFHLAEQLARHQLLDGLYTIYHQQKNSVLSKVIPRQDMEGIPVDRIQTYPILAPLVKWGKHPVLINSLFDTWVARQLAARKDYRALIGWSGMSIRSIRQAKADGKIVIVERGSSHIGFQIPLLEDEYSRWGFQFKRDNRVIDQEYEEYERADYIAIPSEFVRSTFLQKGIDSAKLFRNNFGSNRYFQATQPKRDKFTILYVGSLSLRKGLPYLFQALNRLAIDPAQYDVWFVGTLTKEIESLLPRYRRPNWKFFGHINHYQLAEVISPCSIAIHPSLEEGLSMVIPQLMSCGVPVIATTNTGGADIITDDVNGIIIPIRSADAIADAITKVFSAPQKLADMQLHAAEFGRQFGTWENYGDRYASFLQNVVMGKV